ncbi:sigma-70 RNA polymerase sigma factor region 4 domain-containing protein [Lutibacter flavus]|uniref:Uncharacterized protein n=1 Tax=Lutibacter flavus TaxID=691689 RepID=A0A238VU87_9FLAO|nr:response regulator transcription factor [Lutibacter flavus]SNR37900.1 hypothetical protein SAMN04488111_1050 [Lutibacter flavus]
MEKCKWCGKPYKDGLFSSGFCSKKCEIEGGDSGVKKRSPFFGIIVIIIIGIYIIFFKNNSESEQVLKENPVEENYTLPEGNSNATNRETKIYTESSKEQVDNNSQNEKSQVNSSIESSNDSTINQELNESSEATENQEEIVINLLKNGKSVKEIANLTGLSRHEVRVIKRKIK